MTVLFEPAGWGNSVRVRALGRPYQEAADLDQRTWRTVHLEVVAVPFRGTIATVCTPTEIEAWAASAVPPDRGSIVLGGGRAAAVTLAREDALVEVSVTPSGDDPYPRITFCCRWTVHRAGLRPSAPPTLARMTIQRMEHVGVVVDDLAAAVAFFVELGMELEGETAVEGRWVDRVVGLDGVRVDVAIVRTPDGHGKLELAKFHAPTATTAEPYAPANTPGIRHILFAVDDIDDALARLRPHGAELVGEVARYEDSYRLCYVRGPEGIIVELAEEIS